jgi:hypothetical protein
LYGICKCHLNLNINYFSTEYVTDSVFNSFNYNLEAVYSPLRYRACVWLCSAEGMIEASAPV